MKSLSIPIFAVLTVVTQADSYIFPPVRYSTVPMQEMVTIHELPSYPMPSDLIATVSDPIYVDERIVTPVPHGVGKPTEKPIAVPLSLEPLAPVFPKQDFLQTEEETTFTFRGQVRSVDEIKSILDSPPLVAGGAVEAGIINQELTGGSDTEDSELDSSLLSAAQKMTQTNLPGHGTGSADPLGHGVLLFATVITTMGLVYMAFVAYDYRQRWLHSMTTQNDRYLGGAFDMEMEDGYGSSVSFSDGFGLKRRSSV